MVPTAMSRYTNTCVYATGTQVHAHMHAGTNDSMLALRRTYSHDSVVRMTLASDRQTPGSFGPSYTHGLRPVSAPQGSQTQTEVRVVSGRPSLGTLACARNKTSCAGFHPASTRTTREAAGMLSPRPPALVLMSIKSSVGRLLKPLTISCSLGVCERDVNRERQQGESRAELLRTCRR